MTRKTKKKMRMFIAQAICVTLRVLFIVGLFIPIGSLGALENERIGFTQFFVQCAIGLLLSAVSGYSYYKIYEED